MQKWLLTEQSQRTNLSILGGKIIPNLQGRSASGNITWWRVRRYSLRWCCGLACQYSGCQISLSVRHVSLSSASRQASSNPFGRTWLVGKREDCEWEHSAHDVVLLIPYMKCCPWYNLSILSSLLASQRSSLVLSVPLRLSVELPSRLQKEPKPLCKPA